MRYMKVIPNTRGANDTESDPWWCRLLERIVPCANPEIGSEIAKAESWWLEVDDHGEGVREIGFDSHGEVIVIAPIGDSYGLLVDAGAVWSEYSQDDSPSPKEFEEAWQRIYPRFQHLEETKKRANKPWMATPTSPFVSDDLS